MCTTCGCGEHQIQEDLQNNHEKVQNLIIHHHYYHQGNVQHYYYGCSFSSSPSQDEQDLSSAPPLNSQHNQHDHHDHNHHSRHHGSDLDSETRERRIVQIEENILKKNNQIAEHNRHHFQQQRILALNLVSSPGSGKTTLLIETIKQLLQQHSCAVIEGDQQTSKDVDRIRQTGVQAIQINTGKGCHLDAQMVHDATHHMSLEDDSILFIENVGNLICPASFDLGERSKVVVLSVTEGEEKPLKYPHMFAAADLMVINKIDLLPHLHFDVEQCIANAQKINSNIKIIQLSALTKEGMDEWVEWIKNQIILNK